MSLLVKLLPLPRLVNHRIGNPVHEDEPPDRLEMLLLGIDTIAPVENLVIVQDADLAVCLPVVIDPQFILGAARCPTPKHRLLLVVRQTKLVLPFGPAHLIPMTDPIPIIEVGARELGRPEQI